MAPRKGVEVTLDQREILLAADLGVRRQVAAMLSGRQDSFGFERGGKDPWRAHIEGVAGELAVAKVLNVFWTGTINTYRSRADVGSLEVKTRSKPDYELLVRPHDRDDAAFVLVTGEIPTYTVVGWILARDAKRPVWLQMYGGRPPAYFVPHDALHPMAALARADATT